MDREPTRPGDDLLREFLAHRDASCPGCGYNLRGLTGAACPECAEPLRLQVGAVEPRMGLLVAGIVGLSAGLGFSTFVGAWGTLRGASPGLPLASGVFVLATTLALWWWKRGWIRRRGTGARTAMAAACWAMSLAFVWWFIVTIE